MTKPDQTSRSWFSLRRFCIFILLVASFCTAPLVIQRFQSLRLTRTIGNQGGEVSFRVSPLTGPDFYISPNLEPLIRPIRHISTTSSDVLKVNDQFIDSLGNQTKLASLYLGTEKHPTKMSDHSLITLTQYPLSTIIITGGNFTDKGVNEIVNISTLEYLGLHHLKITGAQFHTASHLKKLQFLDLSHTKITNRGLEKLSAIPNLIYLNLSHTCVNSAGLPHILNFQKLRRLNINNLPLSPESISCLAKMKKLYALSLQGASITDALIEQLSQAKQITHLTLIDTRLTDRGLISLGNMTNLEHLQIKNSAITDAGLEYLKTLKKLEYLDLSENQLTHVGLKYLSTLENLEILYMADTELTDSAKDSPLQIPQLKDIWVYGTKMSAAGIKSLRNAGIEVYTDQPKYSSH